jgi:hypothetical protein
MAGTAPTKRAGRQPGTTITATCHVCGTVEQSGGGSNTYRCAGCRDKFAAEILLLSDAGYSQGQIAARLQLSQNTVSLWCRRYGIVTRFKKPQHDKTPMAIGIGQQTPKLMPSRRALSLVSIFGMGA